MNLGGGLGHLTYSTLVHPGDTWAQMFESLQAYLPRVKARVSPNAPFGVCLRLSAKAARTLVHSPADRDALKRFFDKQGLMRESSKDLFEEFLSRGMGNKQLVIGYEAQLVEYNIENPQAMANRQNAVRTLYPRPTVWSAHPLIALTGNAKRLVTALKDPQIQDIAWRKHGFRSATGATNDPKAAGVAGIPATIDNIVQLPAPGVMQTIENKIKGK